MTRPKRTSRGIHEVVHQLSDAIYAVMAAYPDHFTARVYGDDQPDEPDDQLSRPRQRHSHFDLRYTPNGHLLWSSFTWYTFKTHFHEDWEREPFKIRSTSCQSNRRIPAYSTRFRTAERFAEHVWLWARGMMRQHPPSPLPLPAL